MVTTMEKITLTKKEAAELLGISTRIVTEWVAEGRLKAYRMSSKPQSPYLFTREDCIAALIAVPVESRTERHTPKVDWVPEPTPLRLKRVNKELEELLKPRKRKSEAKKHY
ncbi:TPA: excisionase family DNA-binding protein [Kluyvera intermedia]|nr:excisionase family DNA-binding protein [Kluyvera intermedia]